MASKVVRCNFCGMPSFVPPFAHAIQCLACRSIIYVQPNDPLGLGQGHNCSCRLKDMIMGTKLSNMDMRAPTINMYSESGTPGSGFDPSHTRPSLSQTPVSPGSGFEPKQAKLSPSLTPVSAHGRKRAVLCGVSYFGQKYKLRGTVNDVKIMRQFLTQKHGFPGDSILVLTEEESDPLRMPTKYNIRSAMKWLVQGCQSGDSLVFLFSGHGSQQVDFTGDEIDGYDEMLWPVDHQREGTILDDEINATIVRPLPRGVTLHAIIDACHSGTILDLPFLCRMNRNGYCVWEDHRTQAAGNKGTSGGLALSFSACDDHQVSVDTTAMTGKFATGAMTYSFIQAAESEPGLTYGRLLTAMRKTICESSKKFPQNGPAPLLKNVMQMSPPIQEPQLCSSEQFDAYTKKFAL